MLTLLYDQQIPIEILADDIPALPCPVVSAAYPKTSALTERIIHQPVMFPDDPSPFIDDVAALCRKILHEKLFEIPFADKAYAGAVFL